MPPIPQICGMFYNASAQRTVCYETWNLTIVVLARLEIFHGWTKHQMARVNKHWRTSKECGITYHHWVHWRRQGSFQWNITLKCGVKRLCHASTIGPSSSSGGRGKQHVSRSCQFLRGQPRDLDGTRDLAGTTPDFVGGQADPLIPT